MRSARARSRGPGGRTRESGAARACRRRAGRGRGGCRARPGGSRGGRPRARGGASPPAYARGSRRGGLLGGPWPHSTGRAGTGGVTLRPEARTTAPPEDPTTPPPHRNPQPLEAPELLVGGAPATPSSQEHRRIHRSSPGAFGWCSPDRPIRVRTTRATQPAVPPQRREHRARLGPILPRQWRRREPNPRFGATPRAGFERSPPRAARVPPRRSGHGRSRASPRRPRRGTTCRRTRCPRPRGAAPARARGRSPP